MVFGGFWIGFTVLSTLAISFVFLPINKTIEVLLEGNIAKESAERGIFSAELILIFFFGWFMIMLLPADIATNLALNELAPGQTFIELFYDAFERWLVVLAFVAAQWIFIFLFPGLVLQDVEDRSGFGYLISFFGGFPILMVVSFFYWLLT